MVETMCSQVTTAVECPVIGEHQEPGFKGALVGLELFGRTEYVQEHLLHRIFCFRIFAKNSVGNSKYERTVTLEEDGQSVRLICEQICSKLFVGRNAKSQISNEGPANGRTYNLWV